MRKLILVGLLLVGACSNATEPSIKQVNHRCTLYQLPDGTVYDVCT